MLDVRKILTDLGITYKITGHNARTKCWNPNHQDKDPSLSIHLETGMYNCFGCGMKGNILSLVQSQLGITEEETYQYVSRQQKGGTTEEEVYEYIHNRIKRRVSLQPEEVKEIEHLPHTPITTENFYLMKKRGFTLEEIMMWRMGITNVPTERYHNWIYIPIYFNGVLRTWFLRSVFGSGKLYGFYRDEKDIITGYNRSDILFGYDTAKDFNRKVYLVEGIFDKIWFDRTLNQTIAVLSNRILRPQIEILKQYKHVVLVPDNDLQKKDEGLFLIQSAIALVNHTKVSVCLLPSHRKDVNLCTLDELLLSTYKEVSIFDFIQSERYIAWTTHQLNHRIFQKSDMTQRRCY